MMKTIKVLFFGALSEISGREQQTIELSGNLGDLLNIINSENPELGNTRFSIAVNQEISPVDKELSDGDEVALLPPFAGG
jgi:molybdopterin converting factor small subunit